MGDILVSSVVVVPQVVPAWATSWPTSVSSVVWSSHRGPSMGGLGVGDAWHGPIDQQIAECWSPALNTRLLHDITDGQ